MNSLNILLTALSTYSEKYENNDVIHLMALPRLSAEGLATMGEPAKVTVFFLPSSLEPFGWRDSGSNLYSQVSRPPQHSSLFSSSTYSDMFDFVRNLIFFTACGGNQALMILKAALRTQGISNTIM